MILYFKKWLRIMSASNFISFSISKKLDKHPSAFTVKDTICLWFVPSYVRGTIVALFIELLQFNYAISISLSYIK